MTVLLIVLAGGLGAAARFSVDALIRRIWSTTFPVATLVINVIGSLGIGLVTGTELARTDPEAWRTVMAIGVFGGFTTFGTAMVETVRLQQQNRSWSAAMNWAGSLVLCVAAAAGGIAIGALG